MIITPDMLRDIHAWDFLIATFEKYWPDGIEITVEFLSVLREHINKGIQPHNQKLDLSFLSDLIPSEYYSTYVNIRIDARREYNKRIKEIYNRVFPTHNETYWYRDDEIKKAWNLYCLQLDAALVYALSIDDHDITYQESRKL